MKELSSSGIFIVNADTKGIPKVHWYGTDGNYNVMIMQLLGKNLEDLFISCGKKLSLKTVLMLIEKMVLLLLKIVGHY